MLPAPPEPSRNNALAQQKANLAMSNIIAVPLNKLTRSARNVRKSGSDSIDDLASSILVYGLIHAESHRRRKSSFSVTVPPLALFSPSNSSLMICSLQAMP
jgi:hypothetical protein